jgi:hypothetical protein
VAERSSDYNTGEVLELTAEKTKAQRIVAGIEARRHLFLILFTAIYALCAIGRANGKAFWYDEVVTLIAARAPDIPSAWKAAMETDYNPPLPHLLVHLSTRWFGLSQVTARLPAIVGFWGFSLCLYVFVARRKGALYGLCALLMPALTRAYYYSAEARAYGPELGFCGVALISWQAAAEKRHRTAALCGLSLSIAAMILCHYYAVLVYLPLAGAEAIRTRNRGRLDWGVWLALAAGSGPVLWRAATIVSVVNSTSHSWTEAYLRQGLEFWETGLAPAAPFAVLLLIVIAVVVRRTPEDTEYATGAKASRIPEHEWAVAVLLALVPLVGVIGALMVTHMFNERYALIGIAGFCLLAPMLAAEFTVRRSAAAVAMLCVLAWGMAVRSLDHPYEGNPFDGEPVLREALEQGPVVIPDGQLYLQMWHYAPERYKSRMIFLLDEAAAVKYLGYDSIDVGVRVVRRRAAVNVMDWADFARGTREFTAYQSSLRPGWVLPRVVAEGASVEVKKTALFRELVHVRMTAQ